MESQSKLVRQRRRSSIHRLSQQLTVSDRAVAERSILVKNLIDDLGVEAVTPQTPIPIPNVNDSVLRKVLEWCEKHRADQPSAEEENDSRKKTTEIDEWDMKFMQVDQEMLFEIILVRTPQPSSEQQRC